MNLQGVLIWLGGSIGTAIAIGILYLVVRWIFKSATAGTDYGVYIRNVAYGFLIVGLIGWTAIDWLYLQVKTGAQKSPIVSDVVSIVPEANKYVLQEGQPTQQVPQQVQPTQQQQQQQPIQPTQNIGPVCQPIGQPPVVPFRKTMTWAGRECSAWSASQVGDQWVFNMAICDGAPISASGIPTKFGSPPPSQPACTYITPQPQATWTPLPTFAPQATWTPFPTADAAEWYRQCAPKWAAWATRIELRTTRVEYGTGVTPIGVSCTLKSGNSNSSKDDEAWYITCEKLGIENFQVNGWVGRSIYPDLPQNSVKEYAGSGDQCAVFP